MNKESFKHFLVDWITTAVPNQTYDSSAINELKELTNQFVDELGENKDKHYNGYDIEAYFEYLKQSMSETNRCVFEFDLCFIYYATYMNALLDMNASLRTREN